MRKESSAYRETNYECTDFPCLEPVSPLRQLHIPPEGFTWTSAGLEATKWRCLLHSTENMTRAFTEENNDIGKKEQGRIGVLCLAEGTFGGKEQGCRFAALYYRRT